MNEWQQRAHIHEVAQRWQEMDSALRRLWGDAYEVNAAAARKILDAGGAAHLQRLAALPLSAQLQVASAYARAGTSAGMSPADVRLAAELLADRGSEYYQKPQDAELAAGARELVRDLFKSAAGESLEGEAAAPPLPSSGEGQTPQGGTDVPAGAAASAPTKTPLQEARDLMKDTKNGAYWRPQHVDYATTRARVAELMAQAHPEPAPPGEGEEPHG